MYKRSELFFRGHDGTKLFIQKWIHPDAKGVVLLTHGQGEHSECYHRLIDGLENSKFSFIGWDLRGHGKSEGLRGYAKDFDDYVLDQKIFFELCSKMTEVTDKPVIALAHSMGGLIQACNLSSKKWDFIKAQILSSPLFGVSVPVPEWKDRGAGMINTLIPKLTLGNEIKNSDLTRDVEIMREFEQDTYRHHRISPGVYLGFKREFPKAQSYAQNISLPTMMHISDKDPVVSSSAAINFFDAIASENKLLKIVEGGKHELYNDTCRFEIYKAVSEFLSQFTKG